MPATCDPSPDAFHKDVLSKGNGQVTITVRWAWDGVSQWPNCNGTIHDVRVQNASANAWTVLLPFGRQAKTLTLQPGVDQTFSGAQRTAIGIEVLADIADLQMVRV